MIKYELSVKAGEYTEKLNGTKKALWQKVGEVHTDKNGGQYVLIDAHINFAAFTRQEGSTRVMVSCFEPREKSWSGAPTTATARPAQQQPAQQQPAQDNVPEEDIPF